MLVRRSNRDGMWPATANYTHTPKKTMERTKNCENNDNDLIASNKDEDHIICSVHSFRLAGLQFRKSNLLKWDTRSGFSSPFVRLLVTKSWPFCNSWLWLLTLKAERINNAHWNLKMSTKIDTFLFEKCFGVRFRCTLWIKVMALKKKNKAKAKRETFLLSRLGHWARSCECILYEVTSVSSGTFRAKISRCWVAPSTVPHS